MSDVLITGIGSVSSFGVRRGLIGSAPPALQTIERWPTRGTRRAYLVPRFKAGEFVPGFKARRLDRLTVWSITAAHLAFRDAGLDTAAVDPARVAVICGTGLGCLERTEAFLASAERYGYGGADAIVFPETLTNSPASHVARFFGLRGPNVTLSCRGISGESALIQARSLLDAGDADLAVVIAGDLLTRPLYEWLEAASVLSDACRDGDSSPPTPFSGRSRGLSPGEGMAAMVLESSTNGRQARVDAYATVLEGLSIVESGVPFLSWGRSPAPSVALIRRLVGDAADVRLVLSGANGTSSLDRMEAEVIRTCFGGHGNASVSAAKSVCGEFEASGLLRLILALSGQGAFWNSSAFAGAELPIGPSRLQVADRGLAVLLGTSAGGGRAGVALELRERRPARVSGDDP